MTSHSSKADRLEAEHPGLGADLRDPTLSREAVAIKYDRSLFWVGKAVSAYKAQRMANPIAPPRPGSGDIWQDLINQEKSVALRTLFIERRKMGIEKYGQPLQRDDGRDTAIDLVQELLDGIAYAEKLRQTARPGPARSAAKRIGDDLRQSLSRALRNFPLPK